jgi:hypothetical protein
LKLVFEALEVLARVGGVFVEDTAGEQFCSPALDIDEEDAVCGREAGRRLDAVAVGAR